MQTKSQLDHLSVREQERYEKFCAAFLRAEAQLKNIDAEIRELIRNGWPRDNYGSIGDRAAWNRWDDTGLVPLRWVRSGVPNTSMNRLLHKLEKSGIVEIEYSGARMVAVRFAETH